jgi:hypothetical protein
MLLFFYIVLLLEIDGLLSRWAMVEAAFWLEEAYRKDLDWYVKLLWLLDATRLVNSPKTGLTSWLEHGFFWSSKLPDR